MSKFYETSTAGISVKFPGPASVQEYDEAAKKEGQCLEDAVFNEIYRGTLPTLQEKAVPKLVELTGEALAINEKQTEKNRARAKTPEAAAKVKDVTETFSTYVGRLKALYAEDKEILAQIDQVVQQTALETPVDPSPSSRAKGPGREYLDKADSILALPADQVEEKLAKIQAAVPTVEFDRDENGLPTRESLANGVKAWFAAQL